MGGEKVIRTGIGRKWKRSAAVILVLALTAGAYGCGKSAEPAAKEETAAEESAAAQSYEREQHEDLREQYEQERKKQQETSRKWAEQEYERRQAAQQKREILFRCLSRIEQHRHGINEQAQQSGCNRNNPANITHFALLFSA